MSSPSNDQQLRVLLANDRLGYNNSRLHGAGRLMVDWTRGLVEQGVDVTTVILREPGRLGRRVLRKGLPFEFLSRNPYDPRTLLDFLRIIRRERKQLLHLQAFGASAFGRVAGWLSSTPTIVHVHADYRYEPRGYPSHIRAVDRILSPLATKVLAISEATADFAENHQRFSSEKISILHNSVNLKAFSAPSEEEKRKIRKELGIEGDASIAVCVARHYEIKGVDQLLRAWSEVAPAISDGRLLLVGDGPLRGDLEALAAKLNVNSSVGFLGYRSDVPNVLKAADVAVVPSRSEGLSLAALEAMGTGLPVVAFRVGGVPEIVRDGENGFLVEPGDTSALAEKIGRVLSGERAETDRLKSGALREAEVHDNRIVVDRLIQYYRETIEKHKAGSHWVSIGGHSESQH